MNDISDHEFGQFQRFIHEMAGIHLSDAKKALVSGRLAKRLHHCKLKSYGDYLRLLRSGSAQDEVQTAIDLLTTNETYFFREPRHFDALQRCALDGAHDGAPFRVWSAASSSGEEAYSIAMVLADCLDGRAWEVLGSDISTRVLDKARTGHYPLERTEHIPRHFLQRYCLKGIDDQHGSLLIERSLRQKVQFVQVNLNTPLPKLGPFDVIFLRNVMIYFNGETKRQVITRVLGQLKSGGQLYIGHAESLHGVSEAVRAVAPSIYIKP